MKITIQKQVTTKEEVEVEIPVPSFWKNGNAYAAIYSEDKKQFVNLSIEGGNSNYIHGWLSDYDVAEFINHTEITAEEFNSAKREAIARLRFEAEESLSVTDDPQEKYGKAVSVTDDQETFDWAAEYYEPAGDE